MHLHWHTRLHALFHPMRRRFGSGSKVARTCSAPQKSLYRMTVAYDCQHTKTLLSGVVTGEFKVRPVQPQPVRRQLFATRVGVCYEETTGSRNTATDARTHTHAHTRTRTHTHTHIHTHAHTHTRTRLHAPAASRSARPICAALGSRAVRSRLCCNCSDNKVPFLYDCQMSGKTQHTC